MRHGICKNKAPGILSRGLVARACAQHALRNYYLSTSSRTNAKLGRSPLTLHLLAQELALLRAEVVTGRALSLRSAIGSGPQILDGYDVQRIKGHNFTRFTSTYPNLRPVIEPGGSCHRISI